MQWSAIDFMIRGDLELGLESSEGAMRIVEDQSLSTPAGLKSRLKPDLARCKCAA